MSNLRFADDIDLMGGSNGELLDLINGLVGRAKAHGMEFSTENIKIMSISMNGKKLEQVTSFKYLGATLCKDGTCSAEICLRNASAIVAMARLN